METEVKLDRKKVLEEIGEIGKDVFQCNRRIMSVLVERKAHMAKVQRLIQSISGCKNIIGIDYVDILEDFEKNGVRGKVVQKAVSNLRRTLFDDSDEAFRKIVFVKAGASQYNITQTTKFMFFDGTRFFEVSIPEPIENNVTSIRDDRFVVNRGKIGLVVMTSHSTTSTIFSYHDIDMFRNAMKELVHDFEGVVYRNMKRIQSDFKRFQAGIRPSYDEMELGVFDEMRDAGFFGDDAGETWVDNR